jgi:hypothetical protein
MMPNVGATTLTRPFGATSPVKGEVERATPHITSPLAGEVGRVSVRVRGESLRFPSECTNIARNCKQSLAAQHPNGRPT